MCTDGDFKTPTLHTMKQAAYIQPSAHALLSQGHAAHFGWWTSSEVADPS